MAAGPAQRARGACDAAYCGRETDEARVCRLSRSDDAALELAGVCTSAFVISTRDDGPCQYSKHNSWHQRFVVRPTSKKPRDFHGGFFRCADPKTQSTDPTLPGTTSALLA